MPYDLPHTGLNRPVVSFAALDAEYGPAPWRVPLVASPTTRVVALGLAPETRTLPHFHPRAVETFQVVRGVVALTIGEGPEILAEPGALYFAARGVRHAIRVPGDAPAVLICSVSPNEDAPDEQIDSAAGVAAISETVHSSTAPGSSSEEGPR